jgi:hypothetical protein
MTFATIEEAWGVSSLYNDDSARQRVRSSPKAVSTPKTFAAPKHIPFTAPTHAARLNARDVRRYISGVYAKHGAAGVLELLGPNVSVCQSNQGDGIGSFFQDPEKMLVALGVLFVAIVLLDVTKPSVGMVSPAPW